MAKKRYNKGRQVYTIPSRSTLRERHNYLAYLDADMAASLYDRIRRGQYADAMIAFDELEEYDDMLSTVADKRESALGEMIHSIRPVSGIIGERGDLKTLAEAQRQFLAGLFGRVQNLKEAVKWLGKASFRGFAHVNIERRSGNIYFNPCPQWFFNEPDLDGTFYMTPDAIDGGELYELIPGEWICRTSARPIDLVALFACVMKYNGEQGWASFLDVFGNPSIFFEYPPGTSDTRAREYDHILDEIIGEGRGGYPNGGKFTTIETQAKGGESFEAIAKWANKKIVTKGTGGLLTVMAESGSGTLAGTAHMEAFKSLAAADGNDIAECINIQFVDAELDRAFPGEPHLVEFHLEYPKKKDLAQETTAIATLAGAGYIVSVEQVEERTGYQCEYHAPVAGYNPAAMPQLNLNRADTPAPENAPNGAPKTDPEDEPPLTEAELAAFAKLGQIDPAELERRRKIAYSALKRAADIETDDDTRNKQSTYAAPMRTRNSGIFARARRFFGGITSIFQKKLTKI